MKRARLPVAVATFLFVVPAFAQDEPPPRPSFPTLPESAPAGTGMIQPCMEELEGSVRCGRYRVYEDRASRSGRTIDLAFVIADALDPHSAESDAITYFFGGPGTSVTRPSPFVIQDSSEMRQKRDLLFLDFRGVGASERLTCDDDYPRGVASRFGEIFPIDHIVACRDRLAERAQLDQYTSNHNMDDLDELRAWLNYTALNLIGGSYGTREAQIYLRRHPETARSAVLTGVGPLGQGGYVTHARGLQAALDTLVAECLAHAACSAAYPDLAETVASVLERVRADPPEVTAEGATVRLGQGEFGYALRGLLYRRAAELPAMLDQAAAGEWQPFADYYLQRSGWVADPEGETGMHFSVICAEDISRVDDETIERETAGTFLGDYLIRGYADVCEVWPYAKLEPSFWEPVQSEVPVLLFSGDRDPVTPRSGGDAVARYLPNSLHVVVPSAGHGIGGPCVGQLQRAFIESASVEGLDPSCFEERPPTDFVLPAAD